VVYASFERKKIDPLHKWRLNVKSNTSLASREKTSAENMSTRIRMYYFSKLGVSFMQRFVGRA